MKKLLALVTVLALFLSCAACAEVSVSFEEVYSNEYGYLMTYDNLDDYLVYYDYQSGYGVCDLYGNPTVPAAYYTIGYIGNERFVVNEKDGLKAVITADNTLLTGFEYYTAFSYSEDWIAGVALAAEPLPADTEEYDYKTYYNGEYLPFLIDHVDIIYVPSGKVGTLSRDEFQRARAIGDALAVLDRADGYKVYDSTFTQMDGSLFESYYDGEYYSKDNAVISRITGETLAEGYASPSENETGYISVYDADTYGTGLLTPDGTPATEFKYNYLYSIRDGYACMRGEEGFGLVDLATGEEVAPCIWDEIVSAGYYDSYVHNGYICVEKDGKVGFCDLNGNITCPVIYDAETALIMGCSLVMTALDGTLTIVAADGVETPMPEAAEFDTYAYSRGFDGRWLVMANAEEQYGITDWHGFMVWDCEADSEYDFEVLNGELLMTDIDGARIWKYEYTDDGISEYVPELDPVIAPDIETVTEPEPVPEIEPVTEPENVPETESETVTGVVEAPFEFNVVWPDSPIPEITYTAAGAETEPEVEIEPEVEPETASAFNFCPNCGTSTNGGSYKFCPECGYQLGE